MARKRWFSDAHEGATPSSPTLPVQPLALGLFLRRIELLEILLRVFVKVLEASFAAKLHLPPVVRVHKRLPHGAEFFPRNHARF